MHLWILRHGEAERETQRDPERMLTTLGETDARAAGVCLADVYTNKYADKAADLHFLASPYRRAQQTAQCALQSFPGKSLGTVSWLVPDADPLAAIRELEKLRIDHLVLVSHQPLVSALGGALLASDYRAGPSMGTASLAEFELSMVARGCATLVSLRHPPDFHIATA